MFFKTNLRKFTAAVLLAVLVFSLCACGSKPSQETYEEIYTSKIDALASNLGSVYKQTEAFGVSNMSVDMELGFSLSESLLKLLRANTSYDFEWVNDTTVRITENMKNDIISLNAGLAHSGKDIIEGGAVIDTAEGDMYVGVPLLSDLFMMQSMNDDMGYGSTSSAVSELFNADLRAMLPNEKNLAAVVKKIFTTFMDNAKVDYEEDALEVNGVSQECVVYEIEMSEKELAKAALEILNELADNMAFEKLVTDLAKSAKEAGAPVDDANEIYEELVKEIESMADELDKALDEDYFTNETVFTWTSYITDKKEIIGTEIRAEVDGEKLVVFIGSAHNKDQIGTEIYVKQGSHKLFDIIGELTDDGKKLSGTYEIKVEGSSLAFIDLKDVDVKKLEDGYFVGSVSLSPSKGFIDMVKDEMDFDASVIGFTLGSLSVKLDVTKNDGKEMNGRLSLMNGTEEYVAITAKTVIGEGTTVKLPDNTTENPDEWAQSLDLNKLVSAVKDSELPDYVKQMVESMLMFSEY